MSVKKKIYPADISKYNSNRGKENILLMIRNAILLHFFTALSRSKETISIIKRNNICDFYCLNFLPSLKTTKKISSFKRIKNKHDVCRGKNFMKNLCESLREHAMKIINFKQCT